MMVTMALTLAGGFVAACLWALTSGQFDDLQTPAMRILKEDKKIVNIRKDIK
jgi:cbb3-type cytochrome oxidase maturation protein